MASSTLISNPVTNSDHRRKKKKKIQPNQEQHLQSQPNHAKWKSETQQQIYSSKLLQALSRVSLNNNSTADSNESQSPPIPPHRPTGARVVREAADRVLAVAAKGRSRWSRAILTNRLKLKFRKANRRQRASSAIESSRSKKPRVSVLRFKGKNLPAMQRKVRVLGRLVPGCRKEPLPVILEEATDYIAALEMQVRAMGALADLLSGAGSSSGADPSSAPAS